MLTSSPSAVPKLRAVVGEPIERLPVEADEHALSGRVVVEGGDAVLEADAGVLEAAPGRRGIDAVMVVDPHRPGAKRVGDGMRTPDVVRPDGRAKSVVRVVGEV